MKIFVASHKKMNLRLPNIYEFVQVGNGEKFTTLTDKDFEDNISSKNPNYCELTVGYMVWKNIKDQDIVGLAHYRRYFTTNRFSSSTKYIIDEKRIRKDLTKYDFITTKLYKTNISVKEIMLKDAIKEKDLNILIQIIKTDYPDYYDEFINLLNGNTSLLLNMMICKKELWDKYYSWLFSILEKVEKQVDLTGYTDYQKRIFGFFGERLLLLYILHNKYRFKSYSVLLIGEPKFRVFWQTLSRLLHLRAH